MIVIESVRVFSHSCNESPRLSKNARILTEFQSNNSITMGTTTLQAFSPNGNRNRESIQTVHMQHYMKIGVA